MEMCFALGAHPDFRYQTQLDPNSWGIMGVSTAIIGLYWEFHIPTLKEPSGRTLAVVGLHLSHGSTSFHTRISFHRSTSVMGTRLVREHLLVRAHLLWEHWLSWELQWGLPRIDVQLLLKGVSTAPGLCRRPVQFGLTTSWWQVGIAGCPGCFGNPGDTPEDPCSRPLAGMCVSLPHWERKAGGLSRHVPAKINGPRVLRANWGARANMLLGWESACHIIPSGPQQSHFSTMVL